MDVHLGVHMVDWLLHIHLLRGWLPTFWLFLTAAVLLATLVVQLGSKHRKKIPWQILIGIVAGGVGYFITWLISDVFFVFGVSLGYRVITVISLGIASLGYLIAALVMTHGYRRVLSAVGIPILILFTLLRVNMVYGEFILFSSVFGVPVYPTLNVETVHKATMTVAEWDALASAGKTPSHPEKGEVRSISIKGKQSGFNPRPADIYLPPAALSAHPPKLPVLIMLGGQPGSPDRFFTASNIAKTLDAYAKAHNGLAPIVVSPDQNGSTRNNSLCVDSPVVGNVETYITKDVTNWVNKELPVDSSVKQWGIGGFSQGGTCATQLGPRHPELYGHIIPMDGEIAPTEGSREEMINRYFNGDEEAYQAQIPIVAIKQHAPSTQTMFSAAGDQDSHSIGNMHAIGRAAEEAGMTVKTVITAHSGHDWNTVKTALPAAIDWLGAQMGLGTMTTQLEDYPGITVVTP
ncbi:alpha/beta hydrolase-fold protein [Bifidobacterium crudilactis]|jgi:S-formylglutathione hydrolase FrmB|uniref:alpha/beta hydrolase-fold protein n=2 Tax=Bifidobacterium crudilactis TaxID=327277 RepID=UPI002F34F0EE